MKKSAYIQFKKRISKEILNKVEGNNVSEEYGKDMQKENCRCMFIKIIIKFLLKIIGNKGEFQTQERGNIWYNRG